MGSSGIFESIFKRELTDNGRPEFLEELAAAHPYFTPAQFFLLAGTPRHSPAYEELALRTSVLFNNPHWLQFLLLEMETGPADAEHAIPESAGWVAVENEGAHQQESPRLQPEIKGDNPAGNGSAGTGNEQDIPVEERSVPAAVGGESAVETREDEVIPGQNHIDGIIAERDMETLPPSAPDLSSPTDQAEPAQSDPPSSEDGQQATQVPLLNDETAAEEEVVNEEPVEPLNFRLNIDSPDTKEQEITFEPLHASDYFASQGIKLSGEIKPADKLGKQLKSFTEWLKTMKKVHPDQLPPLTGQADMSIQQLAERSNKEAAVVTEAMADVLLQQGKTDKAREVYRKLSLLNPSKSAYFAAKIDQLKEH
jgi:hypothetical protein